MQPDLHKCIFGNIPPREQLTFETAFKFIFFQQCPSDLINELKLKKKF